MNEAAGLIFKACDGATSVAEVSRRIEDGYGLSAGQGEAVVGETLEKFQDLGLLETGHGRRRFLSAAVAAVPLAVILSMVAPQPAAAASTAPVVSLPPL